MNDKDVEKLLDDAKAQIGIGTYWLGLWIFILLYIGLPLAVFATITFLTKYILGVIV